MSRPGHAGGGLSRARREGVLSRRPPRISISRAASLIRGPQTSRRRRPADTHLRRPARPHKHGVTAEHGTARHGTAVRPDTEHGTAAARHDTEPAGGASRPRPPSRPDRPVREPCSHNRQELRTRATPSRCSVFTQAAGTEQWPHPAALHALNRTLDITHGKMKTSLRQHHS